MSELTPPRKWLPIADLKPDPERVLVHRDNLAFDSVRELPIMLSWSGREFAAVCRVERRRLTYFALPSKEGGKLQRLPLERDLTTAGEVQSSMADEPDAWCPLDPRAWSALPESPAHWNVPEGVMLSRGKPSPDRLIGSGRLQAMAEQAARAERIKAEIEAEIGTETVPASAAQHPKLGFRELITKREVRERLHRALVVHAASRYGPTADLGGNRVALGFLVGGDLDADRIERSGEATAVLLNDELEVLSWMNGLSKMGQPKLQHAGATAGSLAPGSDRLGDWDVVNLVAHKWNFASIGKRTGESDDQVAKRYRRAIDYCWRNANIQARQRSQPR